MPLPPTNASGSSGRDNRRARHVARDARAEVAQRLAVAGIVAAEAEARFLVEEVSGYGAADWPSIEGTAPSHRVRRRGSGRWSPAA